MQTISELIEMASKHKINRLVYTFCVGWGNFAKTCTNRSTCATVLVKLTTNFTLLLLYCISGLRYSLFLWRKCELYNVSKFVTAYSKMLSHLECLFCTTNHPTFEQCLLKDSHSN